MSDKIEILSLFKATDDNLRTVWSLVSSKDHVDPQTAARMISDLEAARLERHTQATVTGGQGYLAQTFSEAGNDDPSQTVTFYSPVDRTESGLVERAPTAIDIGENLAIGMFYSLICCGKEAISFMLLGNVMGSYRRIVRDPSTVKPGKAQFFAGNRNGNPVVDIQVVKGGSHAAMHALQIRHDCGQQRGGFVCTPV